MWTFALYKKLKMEQIKQKLSLQQRLTMKLFIAILLFSAGFIPADFHPIDDLISSELTDLTESSNGISETSLEVTTVANNKCSNFSSALS